MIDARVNYRVLFTGRAWPLGHCHREGSVQARENAADRSLGVADKIGNYQVATGYLRASVARSICGLREGRTVEADHSQVVKKQSARF